MYAYKVDFYLPEMVERYDGVIEYFKLSKEEHTGPYSNSKPISIAEVGIRDEQGLHEVKLPINLTNPFSVRLTESELLGQKVSYTYEYKITDYDFSGPVWSLQVGSGKFAGIQYDLEELTDF